MSGSDGSGSGLYEPLLPPLQDITATNRGPIALATAVTLLVIFCLDSFRQAMDAVCNDSETWSERYSYNSSNGKLFPNVSRGAPSTNLHYRFLHSLKQ